MDQVVTVDKVRRATVVVGAGMAYGKTVDVNIVGPHTASSTTVGHPDRAGKVNERTVGGTSVDSQRLGKTGWTDTQNG